MFFKLPVIVVTGCFKEIKIMKTLKLLPVLVVLYVVIAAQNPSGELTAQTNEPQYEAMNPWADVDPIPPKAISPRLSSIEGKKIGVFANSKRSAIPQMRMVEKRLKEKFPTIQTDLYHAPDPNYIAKDSPDWGKFSTWIQSMDAIILAVGD